MDKKRDDLNLNDLCDDLPGSLAKVSNEEKQAINTSIDVLASSFTTAALEVGKALSSKELMVTMKKVGKFYEENKDAFENLNRWEDITGLSKIEMNELPLFELMELVRQKKTPKSFSIPTTKFPSTLVMPKDKVSNTLFNGEIAAGLHHIATESRKSKTELTAVVNIAFDELEGVTISRTMTAYDREVHDAIVSLFVDGGNDYITPLMIYRTMTGNPKAKLTVKPQQAISESVSKCSSTRIRIDAKNEAKAYNMDKLVYEGNLIYTEVITGEHNGVVSEWIHIMKEPVLYDYANSKNQIARPDIHLLNTPVNKNEETIILQGYLLRRISTMQGSKMSRNILYETIYKQLDIQAASPGALRKKETKVRNTIKEILDFWVQEKWINGYKENKGAKNASVSLTILID